MNTGLTGTIVDRIFKGCGSFFVDTLINIILPVIGERYREVPSSAILMVCLTDNPCPHVRILNPGRRVIEEPSFQIEDTEFGRNMIEQPTVLL